MKVLIILLLFSSCAKVSYLAEQGVGQIALEWGEVDADEFIKNESNPHKNRDKVALVLKAKSFFYKYFNLKETPIYDEVKVLKTKAVTYLVIHSKPDFIKAEKTWFPIMGNFPYLGFFSKKSADDYAKEKKEEGFHVFTRPVFAYSTLNHPLWPWYDNILSSFFIYDDKELVELIFHELVHTIFFLSDDIEFNENLAEFISQELSKIYFNWSEKDLEQIKSKQEVFKRLALEVNKSVSVLNERYKIIKNSNKVLNEYLKNEFYPSVKGICSSEQSTQKCWPLRGEWNNARFAAYATYQARQNEIKKIYKHSKLNLKDFVHQLILLEESFNTDEHFIEYIKKEF